MFIGVYNSFCVWYLEIWNKLVILVRHILKVKKLNWINDEPVKQKNKLISKIWYNQRLNQIVETVPYFHVLESLLQRSFLQHVSTLRLLSMYQRCCCTNWGISLGRKGTCCCCCCRCCCYFFYVVFVVSAANAIVVNDRVIYEKMLVLIIAFSVA